MYRLPLPLVAVCVAGVMLLLSLTGIVLWMYPTVSRIDSTSAAILVCKWQDKTGKMRSNPNCLTSMYLSIGGSVRASTGAVAKAAPEISQSLSSASAESVATSKKTGLLVDEGIGAVKDLRKVISEDIPPVLQELRQAIASLNTEIVEQGKLVRQMEVSGNEAVLALKSDLDALQMLEGQLSQDMAEMSPRAIATVDAALALISSPHWENTLASIDKGAMHSAEITESVDIATRGLRKKAALVKAILLRIASMVKVAIPW